MLKKLLSDSVIYTLSQALFQGLPILILPLLLHSLTPQEYGIYELFAVGMVLITLMIPLEVNQGFAREYVEKKTDQEKASLSSSCLWYTGISYSIFLFTVPLWHYLLITLGVDVLFGDVLLVAVAATTFGVFLVFQNQLRWDLRALNYLVTSVIYVLITMLLSALGLIVFKLGWQSFFVGQIVGAVVASLVGYVMSYNLYRFTLDSLSIKKMLAFSIPLVPSSIFVWSNAFMDRFLVQEFLGPEKVGVYGASYRIAMTTSFLLVGLRGALTPILYRRIDHQDTPKDLELIFRWILLFSLTTISFFFLYSQELLSLFGPETYLQAWPTLGALSLSCILSRLYIFAPGMDIQKRTKLIALISFFSFMTNFFCNLLLIPRFGIIGAALATVVSSIVLLSSYMAFSQRLFFIPYAWRRYFYTTALFCTLIVADFLVKNSGQPSTMVLSVIKAFAIGIFAYFGLQILKVKNTVGTKEAILMKNLGN